MALVRDLSGNDSQSNPGMDQHVNAAADGTYGGVQVTTQVITIGVASVQSNPFNVRTQALRLVAKTAAARFTCGPAPQTATATSPLLAAGAGETVFVRAGWVIAAIQDTGAGELDITELG